MNAKGLEEKLNFIDDAKKTNIDKINVQSIEIGRVKQRTIALKKHYEFGVHLNPVNVLYNLYW